MRILSCTLGVAIMGVALVRAAGAEAPKVNEEFEARVFSGAQGKSLPYLLLRPAGYDAQSGKKYPLLVFLHGAGERGVDNRAQITHGKKVFLAVAKEHGSFVIAPQCPPNARWVEVDWSAKSHLIPAEPSVPMGLLLELLPALEKEFAIDADRRYVMGLSMGGYGTWDLIQRWPAMFAAAVPVCGGGDVTKADRIARVPVWAFHGDKDGAVPVSRSRDMIAAIKKAGGAPRYTESPNIGHNVWNVAFREPELLPWLFAQKRGK